MALVLYLLGTILALFYFFVKRKLGYWKRLGVPHIEPDFFYGNSKGIDSAYHNSEFWKKMYTRLKGKGPVAGIYVYTEPIALITDLELAKRIFIKDFDFFCNRGGFLSEKSDPTTAHLINIEDERWKNLRNRVTPFFMTGKLKNYFLKITKIADIFVEKLETEKNPEIRQLVTRLVIDVLGSVLLSKDFNQVANGKSEVTETVMEAMRDITFTSKTLGEIYRWLLADILHVKVIPKKVVDMMQKLLDELLERREKGEVTDDLVDLLYALHRSKDNPIAKHEVLANTGVLFIGGQDNLQSSIIHTLYELSKQPNVQQRCRESIRETMKQNNVSSMDELNYETIMDMAFLEQCIFETFRMYSLAIFTRRTAKYDYKVPNTDITIKKGTMIQVPFYGIHNDPDIYTNPDVYDPDRMHPSEMAKRHKLAFTPFGIGPHQCIAFRLGLLTVKTTLVKTILNYEFVLDREKTPSKLMFNPKRLFITSDGVHDIYLKFKKIKE